LPNAPIQICDDEKYVRKYEAVRAGGSAGGTGTLYVTNARIIFYATAKGRGTQRESQLLQQTRLQDITGVAAYVAYRISLGLVLVTVIFTLGLLAALDKRIVIWIVIDAAVVATCLLMLLGGGTKRGGAGVRIQSASTETSPINFGSFAAQHSGLLRILMGPFARFFRAYTAFDVAFGEPGVDSERVVAELGALILDFQTRGDAALERWGEEEDYRARPGEPARGLS
jgi:hypothetical protein